MTPKQQEALNALTEALIGASIVAWEDGDCAVLHSGCDEAEWTNPIDLLRNLADAIDEDTHP